MLYAKVTLWVKQEETTSDSKVVLYRGDYNVDIEFTIKSVDYVIPKSAYAQMLITRPFAETVFSQIFKIENGKVTVTISRSMIDGLNELESYSIQIRLFDNERVARATLPPCYNVLHVKNPIANEPEIDDDAAVVNYANVNYARISTAYENLGDIFSGGVYNKTTWIDGDLITDDRLNKIEEAIYVISEDTDEGGGMTDEEREQLEKNTNDIATILDIIDTPPSYSNPSLSISVSPGTIEHNKNVSITISPNFTKNDAGSITRYSLTRNGASIYTGTSANSYTDTIQASHGESISYSATVSYAAGPVKNTLLGIPYPETSIKAGSVTASGSSRAYALSYYGITSLSGVTENDISTLSSRLSSSKSYTYTANLTEQRVVYMYPKSFGALTSIKDANNFDYINSYTRTTSSYNGVEYYIYILTDPVTITSFKQIFN